MERIKQNVPSFVSFCLATSPACVDRMLPGKYFQNITECHPIHPASPVGSVLSPHSDSNWITWECLSQARVIAAEEKKKAGKKYGLKTKLQTLGPQRQSGTEN